MPARKLNLDLAVGDRMAFGFVSGMTDDRDRQELRQIRVTCSGGKSGLVQHGDHPLQPYGVAVAV